MNSIYTEYDRNIGAYVVSFLEEISLYALEAWETESIRARNEQSGGGKSGQMKSKEG